jgi:CCR4-NOT transcription complex subunit 6
MLPAAVLGRAWVAAAPGVPAPSAAALRVCTWNVLAQCYTRSSWQTWCPSDALKWKKRSAALLRDIAALSPDILMLQEVDEYAAFWEPEMRAAGWAGVYKQRTGTKKDGCAIFWRATRFQLERSGEIEHNDLAIGLPARPAGAEALRADGGGELDARTRLERDSVGVMAQLRDSASGARLLCATTHLYWDPALADVKAAQASHALRCIAAFRAASADTASPSASPASQQQLPVIFSGDYNSLPDSEVYARLTDTSGAHGLPPLRSAYAAADARGAEPPFTNFTPTFSGTLDYLLTTPDVALHAVLAMPSRDTLGAGLPNAHIPSDHLPLLAVYSLPA